MSQDHVAVAKAIAGSVPKPSMLAGVYPEGATVKFADSVGTVLPGSLGYTITLREPPSANRWWRRHGTTMHLSREAKEYKQDVSFRLNGATMFPTGDVSVVIVWRRSRKSGDLDKRLGVLLDALQDLTDKKTGLILAHGLYANDSQVTQIWARRCDDHSQLSPGQVRVTVSAMPVMA